MKKIQTNMLLMVAHELEMRNNIVTATMKNNLVFAVVVVAVVEVVVVADMVFIFMLLIKTIS